MLIGPRQYAGAFSYAQESGFTLAVRYLYPVDLDGDGWDELIFSGFETQPNTPADYSNTNLTIFGWREGRLTSITTQWLSGNESKAQGVGDIAFGDFNGDGLTDAYLAGYADMTYQVVSYQLLNVGGTFVKKEMGLTAWEHGTAVGDLNGDGYDDVVAIGHQSLRTVWLGSPTGLIASPGASVPPIAGSDAVLADFMGDGSLSLIVVDSGNGAAGRDTELWRNPLDWRPELQNLIGVLPAPTFGFDSHDVRVLAYDFSDDGLDDAIVFSRPWFDGSKWPEKSAVQFLLNQGKGQFLDVTAQQLKGYKADTNAAYAAVLDDFNGDGRLDLFISDSDYEGDNDSTAILLQQQDGTFLETGREALSARVASNGGVASIIKGPDGFYLVTEAQSFGGAAEVHYSRITFPERDLSETLRGTRRDDLIEGRGGADVILASMGNDRIDGGEGIDLFVLDGNQSSYRVATSSMGATAGLKITSVDAIDSMRTDLTGVERIQFKDVSLAWDFGSAAGQVARTLGAVFGEASVSNKEYAGIGLNLLDNGMTYEALMGLALQVKLGSAPTHAVVVDLLYINVVGTAPSQFERDFYIGLLDTGAYSVASLGVLAADTTLNAANIDLVGLSQSGLAYLPV